MSTEKEKESAYSKKKKYLHQKPIDDTIEENPFTSKKSKSSIFSLNPSRIHSLKKGEVTFCDALTENNKKAIFDAVTPIKIEEGETEVVLKSVVGRIKTPYSKFKHEDNELIESEDSIDKDESEKEKQKQPDFNSLEFKNNLEKCDSNKTSLLYMIKDEVKANHSKAKTSVDSLNKGNEDENGLFNTTSPDKKIDSLESIKSEEITMKKEISKDKINEEALASLKQ